MKKLKVVLMALVILTAIGASIAARPAAYCDTTPQYYKLGTVYYPAGVFGDDYTCVQAANTCTYWKPNPVMEPNTYVPCKNGCYFEIPYEDPK